MLQQSGQLSHKNNADKAQGVYKGRKSSLDVAEVLPLCCEEKLGSAAIVSRPRYQRVSAYHVLGEQTTAAVTGNAGIVLAIAEPAGGNHAFGEFLIATKLGAS